MSGKRRVYFNEYNVLMGGTTYLPLVSGLLHASALVSARVSAAYAFMPYIFHIANPQAILAQYDEPAVAAFSLSMWNEQLNLVIAREVKRRFPDCVIIFGGAQVPHDPSEYFARHPFIDIAVRGEGEEAFRELLERLVDRRAPSDLPGVTWRGLDGRVHVSDKERAFVRDLDEYPSPYLEGLYDELMSSRKDLTFQAIIETNRGCPFHCTFCYWGKGGLSRKYRYHGLDRVQAEIDWLGRNKVRYVFNADSNFGMHRRDREIADFLVAVKKRYAFPEKFRTCYGKNTDEKIFEIGSLLHDHQLEKGVTISYQSLDPQVQKNIKRDNIKLEYAKLLHRRFNERDVPVYTELILGLPGETVASWTAGIDSILRSGLKNQLFAYICQVFPNTDLGDPAYQEKFGIKTTRIELTEIHGSVRRADWVKEYEDIVTSTDSMSRDDWRRMLMFSWTTMLLHSLKLGFFVMSWLVERFGIAYSDFLSEIAEGRFRRDLPLMRAVVEMFERKVAGHLAGEGRGCALPRYGEIYWDTEEAAFLEISEDFPRFFAELKVVAADFLRRRGVAFDAEELAEVVLYQELRMPRFERREPVTTHRFAYNLPEYFDTYFGDSPTPLERAPQLLAVQHKDFNASKELYARETILWGRKSGLMMTATSWSDVGHKHSDAAPAHTRFSPMGP
ncbi:MAG: B12-binding domain-containing radical SAM protein [Alphaproteobacteria bacterium]